MLGTNTVDSNFLGPDQKKDLGRCLGQGMATTQ
jgi:hypothetical protein